MGQSPAEGQVRPGAIEKCENVDIGKVGANQERGGPERSAPGETGARQGGADQRVTNGIYGCLISRSVG